MASATLLAHAAVTSVWHFCKNLMEGDDKEECCETIPIHGKS